MFAKQENTVNSSTRLTNITSESLTITFFDGDYANKLDIIQISDEFDYLLADVEVEGDVTTLRLNYTSMTAGLF